MGVEFGVERSDEVSGREAALTKAVLRSSVLLGLSQERLARVIGSSASRVSRMRSGKASVSEHGGNRERKEWENAVSLVRVYRSLDGIVSGDDAARRQWMSLPNKAFGGTTPAEHIQTNLGLADVVRYLDAMRAKV